MKRMLKNKIGRLLRKEKKEMKIEWKDLSLKKRGKR